jgi:hypothetical protein
MGSYNHYVIVKFKDGVEVEELIQDLEKMISGIEHVKSFQWYECFFFFYAFTVSLRSLFVLEEKVVLDVKGTISYWTLYSRVHGVSGCRLLDLERERE